MNIYKTYIDICKQIYIYVGYTMNGSFFPKFSMCSGDFVDAYVHICFYLYS
jgi:hypothetical protein